MPMPTSDEYGVFSKPASGTIHISSSASLRSSTGNKIWASGSNLWWGNTQLDSGGGSGPSFGSDNQIPYTNAGGSDFDYSAGLVYNGTKLTISGATEQLRLTNDDEYASFTVANDGDLNIQNSDGYILLNADDEYSGIRFYVADKEQFRVSKEYGLLLMGYGDETTMLSITETGTSNTLLTATDEIYTKSNKHHFLSGSTEHMTITKNGVGIGTTSPDYNLTVSGSGDKHFRVASGSYKTITTSGAAVGIGTDFSDEDDRNRFNEGLTVKTSVNNNDTFLNTDIETTVTAFQVPMNGSGAYYLASIGNLDEFAGQSRGAGSEPAYLVVGPTRGVRAKDNFMAGGRAVSLILAGTSGYAGVSEPKGYGNFGSLLFHGSSGWTGGARRWLVSNAWSEGGGGALGLSFAQSDSAGVDPTISGSIPSVSFTTDTNYGVTGKGGLLVGTTTHKGDGLITSLSTTNPQLTLANDGSNYFTFTADGDYLRFKANSGDVSTMALRDNGNTYFNGQNVIFETSQDNYFQIKGENRLGFGSGADFELSASGAKFYLMSGTTLPHAATPLLAVDQAGNVGIGTSSPLYSLVVSGSAPEIQIKGNTPRFRLEDIDGGRSDWTIGLDSAQNGLNFAETAVADNVLFLEAGGDVGIGTSSPGFKLDVKGTLKVDSSDSGNNVLNLESNDGLCWASFNDNGTSDADKVRVGANGNKLVFIGGGLEIARMEPGNNDIIWNYDGYKHADQKFVASGGATTMYLDNSTNARVGIGTVLPDTLLHLSGAAADEPAITITSQHGDPNGGQLIFDHASASPYLDDQLGTVSFKGRDDGGNVIEYSRIEGSPYQVVAGGGSSGVVEIKNLDVDTDTMDTAIRTFGCNTNIHLGVASKYIQFAGGEVNSYGTSLYMNYTADQQTNISRAALYVQNYSANSSNPRVGVGTTGPTEKLDVRGNTFLSGSLSLISGSVVDDVTNTLLASSRARSLVDAATVFGKINTTSGALNSKISAAGGTINGTIAADQIGYGASTDTLAGSSNLTYDGNDIKLGTADTYQNIYLEIAASGAGYTAAGIKLLTYKGANRPGGVYSYNHALTAGWYTGPLYGTSYNWGIAYKSSLTDTDGSLESTAEDGNAILQIGTDGKIGIGAAPTSNLLYVNGNMRTEDYLHIDKDASPGLLVGEGGDADIYYDGTDMKINSQRVGSGDLHINPAGGKVGIGTTSPDTNLDIESSTTAEPVVTLQNTTDDATSPELVFKNTRGGGNGSNGDDAGIITSYAQDSTGSPYLATQIVMEGDSATAKHGEIRLYTRDADVIQLTQKLEGGNNYLYHGDGLSATVISRTNEINTYNSAGASAQIHHQYLGGNFNVARNGLHVMAYNDGSYPGYVGIGTSAPTTKLDVRGTTLLSGTTTVTGDLGVSSTLAVTGSTLAVQKAIKNDIAADTTLSDSYSHYLAHGDSQTISLTLPASPSVGDEYWVVARTTGLTDPHAGALPGQVQIQAGTAGNINMVDTGSYIAIGVSNATDVPKLKIAHIICIEANTWAMSVSDQCPTS